MINLENHSKRLKHLHQKCKASSIHFIIILAKASTKSNSYHSPNPSLGQVSTKDKAESTHHSLSRASTKKQGTLLNHHRVLEERNSSLCDLVKALAMTRPNHSINIRPSIYQEQEPNQSRPCSNCRKEKAKTSRRSQSSKPRCNYKEKSNHYELKVKGNESQVIILGCLNDKKNAIKEKSREERKKP
ncbi:unnamed protein product [Cochlearia groenlandica]